MEPEQRPAGPHTAPPPQPVAPPVPPAPPSPPPAPADPDFDRFAPGGAVLPPRRRRWGTVAAVAVAGLVVVVALAMLMLTRGGTDRDPSAASSRSSPTVATSTAPLGPLNLDAWIAAAETVNADLTAASQADDLSDAEIRLNRLHGEARRLQEATDSVTNVSSPGLRSRLEAAGLDLLERGANLLAAARAAGRHEPHRGLLAKAASARVRFETELAELKSAATAAPASPVAPLTGASPPTPGDTAPAGVPAEGSKAAAEAYIRATVGNTTARIEWDVKKIEADLKVNLESATGRKCTPFVDGQGGCGLVYQTSDVGVPFIVVWTGATWQFYALAD